MKVGPTQVVIGKLIYTFHTTKQLIDFLQCCESSSDESCLERFKDCRDEGVPFELVPKSIKEDVQGRIERVREKYLKPSDAENLEPPEPPK